MGKLGNGKLGNGQRGAFCIALSFILNAALIHQGFCESPIHRADLTRAPVRIKLGNLLAGETSQAILELKNATKSDLKIVKVDSSCGCAVGKLQVHEAKPGESLRLELVLQTKEDAANFEQSLVLHSEQFDHVIQLSAKLERLVGLKHNSFRRRSTDAPKTIELELVLHPSIDTAMRNSLSAVPLTPGLADPKIEGETIRLGVVPIKTGRSQREQLRVAIGDRTWDFPLRLVWVDRTDHAPKVPVLQDGHARMLLSFNSELLEQHPIEDWTAQIDGSPVPMKCIWKNQSKAMISIESRVGGSLEIRHNETLVFSSISISGE
ncbi:MAG: DUF1573 domain-containing protein [Planctomycetota bacterium]